MHDGSRRHACVTFGAVAKQPLSQSAVANEQQQGALQAERASFGGSGGSRQAATGDTDLLRRQMACLFVGQDGRVPAGAASMSPTGRGRLI